MKRIIPSMLGDRAAPKRYRTMYRVHNVMGFETVAETEFESIEELRFSLQEDAAKALTGNYPGIPRFDYENPQENDPSVLVVECNLNCTKLLTWKDCWKYRSTIDFDEDELCFVLAEPVKKYIVRDLGKDAGIPVVLNSEKEWLQFIDAAKFHFPENLYSMERE